MVRFLAGTLAISVIVLLVTIDRPVEKPIPVSDPYVTLPEITPEEQEEIECNKANAIRKEGKLPLLKCDDANSRVKKAR